MCEKMPRTLLSRVEEALSTRQKRATAVTVRNVVRRVSAMPLWSRCKAKPR